MKKLLVVLAVLAPLGVVFVVDQARLGAQSGAGVLISEFRTRGPAGGNDEFVELFNATAAPVDISGWKIRGSNAAGTVGDRVPVPAATTLGPGCYYLVVNSGASGYSGAVTGNLSYTTGITDDGGLALTRADDSIVDQVGMSAGSTFGEGTRLAAFGGTNSDRAYARTPAPDSDTGDNATDFVMTAPSGPQNRASVAGCAGPMIDQGEAVISQVYGGGGNSGSVFSNDFVEIFNPSPNPVDLAGWSVQYGSGGGATWSVTALSGVVPPGRYHLVQQSGGTGGTTPLPTADSTGAINMAATDGKIALVRSVTPLSGACPAGGDLVDLVGYGAANCSEGGTPAPGLGANVSAVRAQNGCVDSDVNVADFGTVSPPAPRNSASPLNDCAPPATVWPHDVQGAGNVSTLDGQIVSVRGIVTAKRFNNGFFIQTPDPVAALENDPLTSEGLFVFTSGAPSAVNVGDDVIVVGTVEEFVPSADPNQPPVTEVVTPTIAVQSTGNTLPAVTALAAGDFNPDGGPLQLEKYEGMRVSPGMLAVIAPTGGTVNEANATGSNNGVFYTVLAGTPRPFREAGIDVIDPAPPCDENAASACAIPVFDGNPERLRVDSDGQVGVFPGAVVSTGATLSVTAGVLDYAFRTWTLLPDPGALTLGAAGAGPQAVPAPAASEYQVASFNLQRLFDTNNDPATDDPILTAVAYANRLAKASLIVRNYLRTPDIIGVQEAENLTVLQDLAAKIDADAAAAGQPLPGYQAFLEEGNDIGGIDVGILARANVTVDSVVQWRPDETYINPLNGSTELLNDRPSLVLVGTIAGPADRLPGRVVVVVNHLRSLNGVDDAVDGPRVRAKRKAQGESVAQLLIELQGTHPGVPVVSVGDYNAFEVSDGYVDVLGIIRGDQVPAEHVVDWSVLGLDPNFVSAAHDGDYSYTFDGNAQTLDHVLLSSSASAALSGFAHARIDADFPETLRADPARPERFSDHDPAVARLTFPLDTLAPVFGPVSNVVVPATSFNGATASYALPTAADNLDPVVTVVCLPASGSVFPVGSTSVSCSATDAAGNTGTTSFTVTVTLADGAGSMLGIGQIGPTASRVTFTFLAHQASGGAQAGVLTVIATRPRALPNTLVVTSLADVVFLGTSARFSGTGWWNGQAGFTFVAQAVDNGEPGTGRDTFAVTVRNPQGSVVLQSSGVLTAGNIDKVQ